MDNSGQPNNIDFTVDKSNLYREESFTDLKVASIRRLVPVNLDGTEDTSRTPIFVGHTQLMSQEGPLPIQARLSATTMEEELEVTAPVFGWATLGQIIGAALILITAMVAAILLRRRYLLQR